MKTPDFRLVDGIYPGLGAYIAIDLPYSWLTNKAYEGPGDFENSFYIDIHELIQKRISEGRCGLSEPDATQAKATIEILRKYADLLENTFVLAADAVDQGPDGEMIYINAHNKDAKIWLTEAETGDLTERRKLWPCRNGHTEIKANNSKVYCETCDDEETAEWTKAAISKWNFKRAPRTYQTLCDRSAEPLCDDIAPTIQVFEDL
ncbi:hypothetical protein [Pseudomonas sp. stari2]|uniref:hypothetical protein n=1 Tax=Pseudomonas sp. Stari2 TaxID=2954814 RepID=UPI00345CC3BB